MRRSRRAGVVARAGPLRGVAGSWGWALSSFAASLAACSASGVRPDGEHVLDGFEQATPWTTLASDGVQASAHATPGMSGLGLALDFDFRGKGGYAGLRRTLSLDLPPNYEISFYVRGSGPQNDLQVKLLDASGDNVWWYRRPDVALSADWKRIAFERRQLEFAWGPRQDHELSHAAELELVLAAGSGGGSGTVAFDGLSLRELPLPPEVPPLPRASASSSAAGSAPGLALDGRAETRWQSAPDAPAEQRFTLDFGYVREFGGLILHWAAGAEAVRYDVELSLDGVRWQLARRVTQGNGASDPLLLPEARARYVRLALHQGRGPGYALAEIEVEALAFGANPNAFVTALARDAPRGRYPRGFSGEQSYWTLVGVDGGHASGLLSEDGALELGRGGPSIEPFVAVGSELVSWAGVEITQSLRDGYLPIPSVKWHRPDWELTITAFGSGDPAHVALGARYDLSNLTSRPLALRLVLALRPFQVNPPTQTLNLIGGVSPIRVLGWDGRTLRANALLDVVPLTRPDAVLLSTFDATDFPGGSLPELRGAAPRVIEDAAALASGLLVYELRVAPHASAVVALRAPLGATAPAGPSGAPSSLAVLRAAEDEVAAQWRELLNRVELQVPPAGQSLVDTLRTNLAYILMSRDGPMLRPGTRSYARSWIRDGSMMSASLLRLGHARAARDYFDWYAPHQFESGKVPCCVDARGADPVSENDSPGEFIFLAAELYRFTGDRAALERAWPRVAAAAGYLESLRQQQLARDQTDGPRAWSGLLPPSISHEGYSDKPAYSYWDDFWGLIGYQDASYLAETLAAPDRDRRARERDQFRQALYASLLASVAQHQLSFLPGAADRGDFDPTSTTIALEPGREGRDLPQQLLRSTFDRYWQEFRGRRAGTQTWDAYTPYELRIVGSLVRLGRRANAEELLSFLLAGRRPAAWNQWAEVVGREPRRPRFIGDMPHAWISSDLIRSVLDLFAYSRDDDRTLVIAAGVPPDWLDLPGVSVRGLRTRYGVLDYSVTQSAGRIIFEVSGNAAPVEFAIPWPLTGTADGSVATIDGVPARWQEDELRFRRLPAHIIIDVDPRRPR